MPAVPSLFKNVTFFIDTGWKKIVVTVQNFQKEITSSLSIHKNWVTYFGQISLNSTFLLIRRVRTGTTGLKITNGFWENGGFWFGGIFKLGIFF